MTLLEKRSKENSGSIGQNFMSYPQELGTMERHQHYVMFYINMQANSQITLDNEVLMMNKST